MTTTTTTTTTRRRRSRRSSRRRKEEAQPDAPLSLADKLALTAAARRRRKRREKKARGPAIKLGWFGDVHVLELHGPGRCGYDPPQ